MQITALEDQLRNLDTALLRSFVVVAEAGGMTAAARQLNLTQAAVSQQIKRLEDVLESKLFERDRREFGLTHAGERLLGKAQRMLSLNDEIWTSMVRPEFDGEVRLGVPHDIVSALMPPVLKRFDRAWPRVSVVLDCSTTPILLEKLHEGGIDLTLTTEALPASQGLTLMREPLVWVGAEGGIAHRRDPLPVSLGDERCAFRPVVSEALNQKGRDWRSVCDCGSMQAMEATLIADLSISAMLKCTIPPGVELLPVSADLPALPHFYVNLYVHRAVANPVVNELASHVAAALGNEAIAA